MNGNAITWFEIYVAEMERARRFYETVFQVNLQKLDAPTPGLELWSFPGDKDSYGASGAIVKMEGLSPAGTSTVVYFRCDDCAVEAERAASAGGKVLRPKMPIGEYGYIAIITDTEGNTVGLHSMK